MPKFEFLLSAEVEAEDFDHALLKLEEQMRNPPRYRDPFLRVKNVRVLDEEGYALSE